MKSEERAALLDSLIFFDLHSNNRTLAKVLEQLDDITLTLSTLKADHLLSHLITASYFVTCTRMSYCGSDSPNIVHLQPAPRRKEKKSIERRLNLEQPKQVAGPATDVALRNFSQKQCRPFVGVTFRQTSSQARLPKRGGPSSCHSLVLY
jgi:hypothetical protein